MALEENHKSLNRNQENDYIEDRVNDQIKWYDSKSIKTQRKYKIYKGITIITSAFIPILSFTNIPGQGTQYLVAFLGAIITISEGFISLNKYSENWIRYRSICETLKQEKFMYLNESGVYSEEDSNFSFFVERIETIISQENVNWASLNKDHKKKG